MGHVLLSGTKNRYDNHHEHGQHDRAEADMRFTQVDSLNLRCSISSASRTGVKPDHRDQTRDQRRVRTASACSLPIEPQQQQGKRAREIDRCADR